MSETTTKPSVIKSLQAIRAIACVFVFLWHSMNIRPLGRLSVSIFFVLSGFVMVYSYWNRKIDTTLKGAVRFSFRKIKRLFPLHIIMLLIALVREIIFNRVPFLILLKQFAISAPLIQTFFPNYYQSLNNVAWYFSVCMFLYFAFPFILKMLKRKELTTKSSIFLMLCVFSLQILLGFISNLILPGMNIEIKWFTYCFPLYRIGDFFIGCVLGYVFIKHPSQKSYFLHGTTSELISLVFVIAISLISRYLLPSNNWFSYTCLFIPSSAYFIYVFAHESGLFSKIITNNVSLWFADISSYFFLIHMQTIYIVQYIINIAFGTSFSRIPVVVIAFAITVALSLLYRKTDHLIRG